MQKVEFHIDSDGYPKAQTQDLNYKALAGYLESDIGGSLHSCKEILNAIEAVNFGNPTEWESGGNAFEISISKSEIQIKCMWDETMPVSKLTPEEFKSLVESWEKLIERR